MESEHHIAQTQPDTLTVKYVSIKINFEMQCGELYPSE